MAKIKLDKPFAQRRLSAKQLGKKVITGSDAMANPASQAGLTSRPQAWEAGKLQAQFRQHKEVGSAGRASSGYCARCTSC